MVIEKIGLLFLDKNCKLKRNVVTKVKSTISVTPIIVILSHNDPINKGENERLKKSYHGLSFLLLKNKNYYDVKSLTYIF